MRFIVLRAKHIAVALLAAAIIPGIWAAVNKSASVFNTGGREIPIYSVERDDNKLALTFDCAWNDDDIDEILETLDDFGVKATFFVVGDWAQKYSDALEKIYSHGHEIGNHSYDHADYTMLSAEQIDKDLAKCDEVIYNITGVEPKLVRAPSGGYNNTVIEECERRGDTYIQWSVDPIDYNDASVREICDGVCAKAAAGDIILLHNGTAHTAEALPEILERLCESYEPVTVSDLIYKTNYTIDYAGRQKKISR